MTVRSYLKDRISFVAATVFIMAVLRLLGFACKAIFDCTVPFDQKENFVRSRFLEIDKDKWAK